MLRHRNTCHNFYIGAIVIATEMRLFRLRFERAVSNALNQFAVMFAKQ